MLKKLTLESVIIKLLAGFFASAALLLVLSGSPFNTADFFDGKSVVMVLLSTLAIAVIMLLLNLSARIEKHILLGIIIFYCLAAAVVVHTFEFAVGATVVVFIAVNLLLNLGKFNVSRKTALIAAAASAVFIALFIGIITVLKYLNYQTPNFDFGIFAQMYHYMSKTLQPLTTCERDGLLSHFAVHFSPIFYLLLPFYWVFPSPITLAVGQAVIVALGIIPLYQLCRKYELSNAATAAFSIIYALSPLFIGGTLYYFHENAFLAPLLLWLFYFWEKNKTVLTLVFAFLVMFVKEDAAVYVAFFALYLLLSKRDVKKGTALFLIAIAYFMIITSLMSAYGLGIMDNRYQNYIFDENGSLFDVVKNILINPMLVIHEMFTIDKIKSMLKLLLPLAFLPFVTKKASRYILILPAVLINFMSDYKYQFDTSFQYFFGSAAFLFYLSIMNYSDLKKHGGKMLLSSVFASAIMLCGLYSGALVNTVSTFPANAKMRSVIGQALELIPENASVISTTFLMPNISARDELYQLDYTDKTAEYYVIDLRYSASFLEDFTDKSGFELVFIDENKKYIAIFRNKTYEYSEQLK